jgi:hypothetical protein
VGCLVGGGVRSAATRRLLRLDGEDVAGCDGTGCDDVAASVLWEPLAPAESRLLLESSLRQLRKMLYAAAEDGEGTCCLMSTRSRKAESWRETAVSTTLGGRPAETRMITYNSLDKVACAAHQDVGKTAKPVKGSEKLVRGLDWTVSGERVSVRSLTG